jgi:hypothetical protein
MERNKPNVDAKWNSKKNLKQKFEPFHAILASKFAKSARRQKNIFCYNVIFGLKIAEFQAKFKSVETIARKFTQK